MKHMIALVILLFFSVVAFGQSDTSQKKLRRSFITNNLNAGVSIGMGGARPFGISPLPALKLGRVTLSAYGWDKYRNWTYTDGGIDATLDVAEIRKSNQKKRTYCTFSVGQAIYNRPFVKGEFFHYNYGMIGFSQYNIGERTKLSGKIGVVNFRRYEEETYVSPYTGDTRFYIKSTKFESILPYAEVSYAWYLYKFQPGSDYDWSTKRWILKKREPIGKISWSKGLVKEYESPLDSALAYRRKYLFSEYFNPGISFGIGGGRLSYFAPSATLKLGPVQLKGMISGSYDSRSYAWQTQFDLFEIKKHSFWPNSQMFVSLSGGVSNFFFSNEGDHFRNYEFLGGLSFYKKAAHTNWGLKVGATDLRRNEFIEGYGYWGDYRGWLPYAEVSFGVTLLKYFDKPIFLDSLGNKTKYSLSDEREYVVNKPPENPILSRYFNPRASLGVGSTHPSFVFPNFGVKIGRLDVGAGFGMDFYLDLTVAANADVEVYRLKKDSTKFLTVGVSGGLFMWEGWVSVHAGVKKYHKRSAFAWKVGAGLYEGIPIPTADFSYYIYLFEF